jgi:hypothetical protein
MNRNSCILFYTDGNENLISNIKNIPFDFLKVTGMNLFYVENKQNIIKFFKKNNIENFPALYISYFDKNPEIFYNENINIWISDLLNNIFSKNEIEEEELKEQQPSTSHNASQPQFSEKTELTSPQYELSKKPVSFLAEQMQKERETLDITTTSPR